MWSITFFRWEIECEEVTNRRLFLLLVDKICLILFYVSFVLEAYLGVVWFCSQLSHTTSNVRMQREHCKFPEKIEKWLWARHFASKFRRYDLTCIWCESLLRAMAVDTSESTAACVLPIGCVFRRSSLKQGVRSLNGLLNSVSRRAGEEANSQRTVGKNCSFGACPSTVVLVWIRSLPPLTNLISSTDPPTLHAPRSKL